MRSTTERTPEATSALSSMPRGAVFPPMVTPIAPDGSVDIPSTASLISHLTDEGVDGLLLLGSSGENALLTIDDKLAVVAEGVRLRDASQSPLHIMAGVTSMGPADAIAQVRALSELGPDSILLPAPTGFPFSHSELHAFFAQVIDSTDVPVVAYEVPSRTHVTLGAALLGQLADEGRIVGIKDSSGQIALAEQYTALARQRPDLVVYTGMEDAIDAVLLAGGDGAIPGLANIFPQFHRRLVDLATERRWDEVRAVQEKINELLGIYGITVPNASFPATFFSLVKESLVQLGVIETANVRAPFVNCAAEVRTHVAAFLAKGAELHESMSLSSTAP